MYTFLFPVYSMGVLICVLIYHLMLVEYRETTTSRSMSTLAAQALPGYYYYYSLYTYILPL